MLVRPPWRTRSNVARSASSSAVATSTTSLPVSQRQIDQVGAEIQGDVVTHGVGVPARAPVVQLEVQVERSLGRDPVRTATTPGSKRRLKPTHGGGSSRSSTAAPARRVEPGGFSTSTGSPAAVAAAPSTCVPTGVARMRPSTPSTPARSSRSTVVKRAAVAAAFERPGYLLPPAAVRDQPRRSRTSRTSPAAGT